MIELDEGVFMRISKKMKADLTARYLKKLYPEAQCALEFAGDAFRLLIMARLSAQCTDKRVNIVSRELFSKFPDAQSMMNADVKRIEELIRTCGLYKTKAQSLHDISSDICNRFGGKVPNTMGELLSMNGVGRKIANLVLGDVFGIDGVVCDTHCIRISKRIGLTDTDYPEKTEKQLTELLDEGTRSEFCHRIVQFGRDVCTARSPKCDKCELCEICTYYKKEIKK